MANYTNRIRTADRSADRPAKQRRAPNSLAHWHITAKCLLPLHLGCAKQCAKWRITSARGGQSMPDEKERDACREL